MVDDMAFMNKSSSVICHVMSSQSISVSETHVFVLGNDEVEGIYRDTGIIAVFDRQFNFLGQARITDAGHGGGSTIVGDKIYTTCGANGYLVRFNISDVLAACNNFVKGYYNAQDGNFYANWSNGVYSNAITGQTDKTYVNVGTADLYSWDGSGFVSGDIPSVSTERVAIDFEEGIMAIDYDPYREEFALFYEINYTGDFWHSGLAILDKNLNIINKFDTDLNLFVTTNYAGSYSNLPPYEEWKVFRGSFGDLAYRNGVVVSVFYYCYANVLESVGYSAFIEIDANTGTPVSFLGTFDKNSADQECEGICFDPDDDDVLWVNHHEYYMITGVERMAGFFLGRVSFSKEIQTLVMANDNDVKGNVTYNGSASTLYVDNTHTGFSTGTVGYPYKSLETALLLNASATNKVKFLIQATNIPYTTNIVPIGGNVILQGVKVNDTAPIIYRCRIKVDGGKLELTDLMMTLRTDKGSGIVEVSNNGLLVVNNVDFAKDKDIDAINDFQGTCLHIRESSSIELRGSVSFTGFGAAILTERGGRISYVENIKARHCYSCYQADDPTMLADGCINNLDVNATVENVIVGRNGKLGFIDEKGNNENLLLGTAKFGIVASDQNCANTRNWRQIGENLAADVVSVYDPAHPEDTDPAIQPYIENGLRYTQAGQEAGNDFYAYDGDGWYTFSALAKGIGKLKIYCLMCTSTGFIEAAGVKYVNINSQKYIPIFTTFFVKDTSLRLSCTAKIYMPSDTPQNSDVTVVAAKVEKASFPSGWTAHVNERSMGGTTAERPTRIEVGYQYFDTTLGKTIVWDGSAWVNVDGSALT